MRGIIQNISWLTAGNAVARPLWLLFLTVICIPILGDDGYGLFTAAIALMAIALTFSDAGLTPYTIREVARRPGDASRFFSNLLLAKGLLGVLFLAAGLIAGHLLGYAGARLGALALAGGYILGLQVLEYCRAVFRAFEDMKWDAASSILEKLLLIAAGTAALLVYGSAFAVLGAMALTMVVLMAIHVGWVHHRFATVTTATLSRDFVRGALIAALPLGIAGQLSVIYFRTDAVMVQAMVGDAAAGQYGAAYRLLEAVVLLTSMVTAAVYPRLSVLYGERKLDAFGRLVRQALVLLAVLGLAQGAFFYFWSDGLMNLLKSGVGVAESAAALRILAFAVPCSAVNFLFSVAFSAADAQKPLAWILGSAALLNLVLNFFWIPAYGFLGAAYATVATESLIVLLFLIRYFGWMERAARAHQRV